MFDVNIKMYQLQESDLSVHEGTSPTTPTARMDESLSGNIDSVQEEDRLLLQAERSCTFSFTAKGKSKNSTICD